MPANRKGNDGISSAPTYLLQAFLITLTHRIEFLNVSVTDRSLNSDTLTSSPDIFIP